MIALLRYLIRGYKWQILLIILVGFLAIGISLSSVIISKEIIDIVTHNSPNNLVYMSVAFLLSLAGTAILRLLSISLSNSTYVRMANTIRLKVFSHLLYTRWQNLKDIHSGDMLTRIIKDTDDVVQLLINSLPNLILSATQLLASVIILYIFDPTLAVMLGIGMPAILVCSRLFYRRMVRYTADIKQTESGINTLIQETLSNQTVVRTFERQDVEINRLILIQNKLHQQVRKRVGLTIYGNIMANAAFSGGYAVAFLWSAWCLLHGTITFGTMTSFLQLVARIQRPMSDTMSLVPSIISSKASIDRLVNLLEYQTEGFTVKGSIMSGHITLKAKDITFRYDDESPNIYEGFNLNVQSGEMVAIMGRTGMGKTTLLRLLLGLIKPQMGLITISNEEQTLNVSESTRSNFIYVPQGNSLLSGSIRDNLLIGDPLADERQLRKILHIAMADFVWELPNGLDTILGEKGLGLSEGQAQRIAIARSLLRPGRIFLFDEATSALDTDTERKLLQNIRHSLSDRIVLFITHNTDVAEACDKVIRI